MAETSTKPYMIRALYEWCCDNGYTPYLAAAVDAHTIVPRQHVKGGEIVLNVSPMATSRLSLGNELVEFQARFSGVAQQISIPIGNVSAIYARETGHGMAFDVSKAAEEGEGGEDAHDEVGQLPHAGDEGHHAPGSTVQSLRGGSRRRGPRSVDRDDLDRDDAASGSGASHGETDGEQAGGRQWRRRGDGDGDGTGRHEGRCCWRGRREFPQARCQGQGSADVIAFAPSGGAAKKKGSSASSRSRAEASPMTPRRPTATVSQTATTKPPPEDGGGKGGKSGKARLTRVK